MTVMHNSGRAPRNQYNRSFRMKSKRAQSATELVTYIGFSLIILLIFLIAIGAYEARVNWERKAVQARGMLWSISSEINGAAAVGDGYERFITLPARLPDNTNYSIVMKGSAQVVQIYWSEGEGGYGLPVTSSNLTGSFVPGSRNRITNTNGIINVEAVS